MVLRVVLSGVVCMLFGVQVMSVRNVGVVRGFVVVAGLQVFGGFLVMVGCLFGMSGGVLVVFNMLFFGHKIKFHKIYIFEQRLLCFLR